jgi:DNA-binding beta-propeller fold protein YncE
MSGVRTRWTLSVGMAAVIVASQACSSAPAEQPAQEEAQESVQASVQETQPTNDFPNPYQGAILPLPDGRTWGSTAGVDIAPDGKHVWLIDRCGSNGCVGSDLDPVLLYDGDGAFVRSFGAGKLAFPHGIHVDSDGNVWVTDPVLNDGRGAGADTIGSDVIKFSPEGDVLMTLGTPGVKGTDASHFNAPADVVVGTDGNIFVADGHGPGTNERIMKFDKDGTFLMEWGEPGEGPCGANQFSSLHALEIDSHGRLFVGDRDNNRIQIFDQDGNYLDCWYQFSRPSGIHIDQDDNIYVADSESSDRPDAGGPPHGDWQRGIRIGSATDGSVKYFIPDPEPTGGSSAAEGVAADRDGIIFGAEVGLPKMMRYTLQ